MDTDVIEQLIRLQELDRVRDRLQRRLDEVPIKLRSHTDRIAALESELAEQEVSLRSLRAEADRAELEVKAKEADREKYKRQMNAPKLSNREYQALQEQLAGVLADINSLSDKALSALERASETEDQATALQSELETARAAHAEAKEKLESALTGVRSDLAAKDEERKEFVAGVGMEPLAVYERVRRKHKDALAIVEGTIDRAAGRIGTDLHCSACFMTITANDAVQVLRRNRVIQCKSCVRILYVP
jgi:predicted  nucleic acid-binding Zn-ribbon protein